MFDQSLENFRDSLDKIDEILKEYQAMKKRQAKFTKEYRAIIIDLSYQYFTAKNSNDDLIHIRHIDKQSLKREVYADKDFKYFGLWMFEEILEIINHFADDDNPADRKRYYRKIEYPVYNEKLINERLQEIEEECIVLTAEQRKDMRATIKEEMIIEEFYDNFDILIHKALKKLSLKYFPEITKITGAGIKEIDYMLYNYMLMTRQNIMKLLDKE